MVESSDMKKKILIQNDPKLSFGDISQKFRPLRLAALTRGLQRWGGVPTSAWEMEVVFPRHFYADLSDFFLGVSGPIAL